MESILWILAFLFLIGSLASVITISYTGTRRGKGGLL
jgi:hypothetical protein